MKLLLPGRAAPILLAALFIFSQSTPILAQRPQSRASGRTRTQPSPGVRFSSGRSATGVPFDFVGNLILLKARVNNSAPLWFIFDTGASSTVLDANQAKALAFKERGRIAGTGTAGTAVASRVRGVSLGFQGVELTGRTLYTLPIDFISAALGLRVGGIIGNDIIREFVVEIDYASKTLNFYDPSSYRYDGSGQIFPLFVGDEGNVFVNARVEIEGREPLTGKFEVDTGSTGSLTLNTPFVKKHRLLSSITRSKQVKLGGVGGTAGAATARVRSIRLGRFELSDPVVRFSQATKGDYASASFDGLLGGQIFSRFKVIVDLQRRRVMLEPNDLLAASFEDDMSGMKLLGDGEDFSTYLIDEVEENSPAAEAGVQGGDILAEIDGRAAREFSLEEIRRMFKLDGVEHLLTLRRGDQVVKARLKLRRLI